MLSGNFEFLHSQLFSSPIKMQERTLKFLPYKEKRHKCPYCLYSSDKTTDVLRHIATHTGQRPYKCPMCERAFKLKHHLRNHLLTHEMKKNIGKGN